MYTECPNCQTAFRITSAQLKAAGGKTRCGRCQTVFNALEQLMDDAPGHSDPVAAQTEYLSGLEEAVDSSPADIEQALSEVTIPGVEDAADELSFEGLSDAAPDADQLGDPGDLGDLSDLGDLGDIDLDEASSPIDAGMELVDEDLFSTPAIESVEGEAVGDGILSEPEPGEDFAGVDLDGDLSNIDLDSDLAGDDLGDLDLTDEIAGDDGLGLDEADDLGLGGQAQDVSDEIALDELDDLDLGDEPLQSATEPAPVDDNDLALDPDDGLSGLDEKFESAPAIEEPRETADDYVLRELGDSESGAWRWLSTLMWSSVILLLLVVLVAQFLYFKREDLVRYPQAKMAIEKMCGLIGPYIPCDVPEARDVSAIQLLERDVRSHPNTKNALLISATILSGAEFVQPFPSLVLTFSDMNQKTIARRIFKPNEYMSSETDLKEGMQSEVPVRIVLEIVDPGPDAVNFEFEFE